MSRYLNEERPILNKTNSDKLILTRRYQPERGCGIHDVVKAYSNLLDKDTYPASDPSKPDRQPVESGKGYQGRADLCGA